MPSQYCIQNPFNYRCIGNPDYTPNTNTIPFPGGVVLPGGGVGFPEYGNNGYPWPSPGTTIPGGVGTGTWGNIPPITITGGGSQVGGGNQLDRILQVWLQSLAVLKGRPYVPTNIHPEQQPIYAPFPQGYNPAIEDGTAAGKVENWVKNNTGVVLIGGAIIVAYLMKSPRSR